MKYDAGMMQFHDDIVAAIKDMIHGENDKVAELTAEISPVPLREYLRNNHGKCIHGGNRFECMSSCMLVVFDHTINNSGEKKLQLSWSQVTSFIRKYPAEIFNEVKENEVKKTFSCDDCGYDKHGCCNYPDTPDNYCVMGDKKIPVAPAQTDTTATRCGMENNLSLGIDELDLDVRTFNAFKRAGINTVEDYLNYPDKDKLRSVVGSRSFEKFLEASKPAELPTVQPERAAEIADTFNYAVLSAELGDYLKRKEEQLKNEYMNFTANCGRIFAEAQERLAKHGFGENNGIFEKWITAMGFTKPTVYRMISIYNFRSSQIETNEGQAVFDALPKTLQADISAPSAPPQLVEQVMSGDITTHKEYIELKKQLEAQMQRYSKALDENHSLHDENQSLRRDRVNAMNRADEAEKRNAELEKYDDALQRENDALVLKKQELEQHVKELESRPVDVMVQSDTDAEKKFNETIRKINLDFENFRDEADKDLADMRNQRNAALDRAEAAEAKLNAPKAESNVKPFVIRMTMDDFSALIEAVGNNSYLKNIIQKAQVLRI